jgi:2-oxo-3-hexenedioate decarboxylase
MTDASALARDLAAAYAHRRTIAPPSSRDPTFDLTAAYAVEGELVRLRRASGRTPAGRKVGYANKAMWRALKLDTLVWAHVYDDTIHDVPGGEASLSIARMYSPKIEPEIVVKLRSGVAHPFEGRDGLDAPAALGACEWIALGFEVIDCVYPDWKFRPADFVASFGLHAALVVGGRLRVEAAAIPQLVDELARVTVKLMKNGEIVEEGSGRNVLRSPALCLAELASAAARRSKPLAAGEVISTGTMTESKPIALGETWTAAVDGIDLPPLTVRVT